MAKSGTKTKKQNGQGAPTETPPETSAGAVLNINETAAGLEKPRELSDVELDAALKSGGTDAPTLSPPEIEAAARAEGITAWQTDKRVVALWCGASIRNSWVHITGVGWKKLHNGSDSAITAMTMMLAHARQMQSPVNYREESDGMIYEVYVW